MSDPPFNLDYIQKLVQGDPEVQTHFAKHFGWLLRIKLRNKLHSAQLIQDITQETFLRVFSAARTDGIREPERLGAFVNAVCSRVMMEHLRASARHRQLPEDTNEVIDESSNIASELVTGERQSLVREIVSKLPAKDRELLRKVYFEELGKDRICEEMNVNPEYLRVLIHRARTKFREEARKHDPDLH